MSDEAADGIPTDAGLPTETEGQATDQVTTEDATGGAVAERLRNFCQQYPTQERFLAGVNPEAPDLWVLIQNFATSGFQWTGSVTPWASVLAGTLSGDCKSVVDACANLANEGFGFDVAVGYEPRDFLVEGGGAIIDGRTGNIDGGAHWAFTNHYWLVTSQYGEIDLLFRAAPLNKAVWKIVGDTGQTRIDDRTVIDWRMFGDRKVFFAGSGAYTLNEGQAYRSPSRSEETRQADKAAEAKDEEQTPQRDRLEELVEEVEMMAPDLSPQWRRWTAAVLADEFGATAALVARLPAYRQFGSGKVIDPQFDPSRWEAWARGKGATDFTGAYA